MALQGDGDRRGPRAWRDAGELDALCGELVHEGCSEGLRYIHTIYREVLKIIAEISGVQVVQIGEKRSARIA